MLGRQNMLRAARTNRQCRDMAKHKVGIQEGNPHRLTWKQHLLPVRSIERFTTENTVQTFLIKQHKTVCLPPRNSRFYVQRVWDERTERISKQIEDAFQNLADVVVKSGTHHDFTEMDHTTVSRFYGLLINRGFVHKNQRPDTILRGVTGWDAEKDRDTLELLEKNGALFAERLQSGESVLCSRMVNGMDVMKGIDAFLLGNPGLSWLPVLAPSGLEFIVPDTWTGNDFSGRYHHQAAIPIAPRIAILASRIFPFPRNLTPAQVAFINTLARRLSHEFYFARQLEASPMLRPFQVIWQTTPQAL